MRGVKSSLLTVMCLLWLTACAPTPEPEEPEAWPLEERTQAHIDLGLSYLQRDNLDVARDSFKKALEVNPQSSKAFHGLGLVEAKALNLDQARTYMKRAVALDPGNIPAVSDYAVMLCEKGASEQGVALLEKNVKHPELMSMPT